MVPPPPLYLWQPLLSSPEIPGQDTGRQVAITTGQGIASSLVGPRVDDIISQHQDKRGRANPRGPQASKEATSRIPIMMVWWGTGDAQTCTKLGGARQEGPG